MDKMTFVAVLIALILSEINCFMWKRRAKDAERELEYYRIAISGLLNRWHKLFDMQRGADRE